MTTSSQLDHHSKTGKLVFVVFMLMISTGWADQFGLFSYTDHGSYIEITDYPTDAMGVVEVPSSITGKPVTHIGDWAFAFCSGLTSVTIPSSAILIGDSSFSYCSSLANVTISSSVNTISKSAFNRCTGLIAIIVHPDNSNFSSLGGLLLNKSQDSILRCPEGYVGSYTIPSFVSTIAESAFSRCSRLTGVTISNSVATIGDSAFSYCVELTSAVIPSSVSEIGDSPFHGCRELTGIIVHPENASFSSVGGFLFDKLLTVLLECPGAYAGSYTIPSSVTVIGGGAFRDCSSLTAVSIPSSVLEIGDSAFNNCDSLTSVTIPDSVAMIGSSAFYNRGNPPPLRQVIFLGDAPTIGQGLFYTSLPGTTVYVFDEASGFTLPTWADVPVTTMGPESPIPPWLLENGLAHDSDVNTDLNGDGVTLLMAYALNLEPRNARAGMPEPVMTASTLSMEFYDSAPGIIYTVQTSNNLSAWVTNGITLSEIDLRGMRTATVDRDSPQRFIRLVVGQE